MIVVLLQCTPEPERLVALAARLCTSPAAIADLQEDVSRKDVRRLVRRVLSMGHASVLEHVVFTYGVEGISRATSHQLVRHRIASYSQQSQRYVAATFGYVTPKTIGDGQGRKRALAGQFEKHMEESARLYTEMLSAGIPPEDARFVLPNATETKILITMNARELHHFFALRLCRRAQWEIREMARRMLTLANEKAPLLFETAGPGCVRGRCPEGKMTCGDPGGVRREFAELRKGSR
ncbi:MAG: FAD-dependent thymidylate synthase [Deltaproteobacteria bacterium RBG_16_64_85]|nr:MAG: FAD-dependent thymidylate synthase [Deltaproteobacteria bacterium RBG_16_64_85]